MASVIVPFIAVNVIPDPAANVIPPVNPFTVRTYGPVIPPEVDVEEIVNVLPL